MEIYIYIYIYTEVDRLGFSKIFPLEWGGLDSSIFNRDDPGCLLISIYITYRTCIGHDSQMPTEAGCTEVEAEELEMLGVTVGYGYGGFFGWFQSMAELWDNHRHKLGYNPDRSGIVYPMSQQGVNATWIQPWNAWDSHLVHPCSSPRIMVGLSQDFPPKPQWEYFANPTKEC